MLRSTALGPSRAVWRKPLAGRRRWPTRPPAPKRLFLEALFDDLNAPEAMAALFTFITEANRELDAGGADHGALERARAAFRFMDAVLDLVPEQESDGELAAWVEERLAARKAARERRDFAAADAARAELTARGILIEDGPDGTRWRRG
ncbi:DALR domain-containing protein [Gemmatimonas sp.]|uniref:DALR domain-containing protein n=1 Tax=Gemmatimonas sp. TaxID=1962908 RepID=UPI003DA2DF22